MNVPTHRGVVLIDAPSCHHACTQVAAKIPTDGLTIIDMTQDFNQNKWLGRELNHTLIFFDNHSKPNGLLAVLGCIKAGFSLFLACDVALLSDYFKRHIFWAGLQHIGLPASQEKIEQAKTDFSTQRVDERVDDEMSKALRLLTEANGIVHLIGERGTGKSTLLGKLLAAEINRGKQGALLSSPMQEASQNTLNTCYSHMKNFLVQRCTVSPYCNTAFTDAPPCTKKFFTQLHSCLGSNYVSRETLCYCPPDKLLSTMTSAQWIIIDEAATLANATLQAVITHAVSQRKKLILSTTTEGYEGTGQSYRLRYLKADNGNSAQSRAQNDAKISLRNSDKEHDKENDKNIIVLKHPKRFAADDPLYLFCRSLCQPSASIVNANKVNRTQAQTIHLLDNQDLRARGWTAACFSLLREAHYKTTPNDLARFYSDDALFAVCLKAGEIIGVAYGLPEQLPDGVPITAIFNGSRRVKNAFTQQALIHAYGDIGDIDSSDNRNFRHSNILRISRIATAKKYRKQKIATRLMTQLQQQAKGQGYDFLSTSFSGSQSNMLFWLTQGFTPSRIGLQPNKANNEYAVLMLKGLTPTAVAFQKQCVGYCQRHIDYFASVYLPHHEVLLTKSTGQHTTPSPPLTTAQIIKEIDSVILGYRDINWLLPTLFVYLQQHAAILTPGILKLGNDLCNGDLRRKATRQSDQRILQDIVSIFVDKTI